MTTATKPKERPVQLSGCQLGLAFKGQEITLRVRIDRQPRDPTAAVLCFTDHEFRWATEDHVFSCPYGIPGDRLYVKEVAKLDGTSGFGGKTDTVRLEYRERDEYRSIVRTFARDSPAVYGHGWWVDARRMPKWASRLMLEIVDISMIRITNEFFWVLTLRPIKGSPHCTATS